MNLHFIPMIAFFLAPILVSPRLLPDAHPHQSLSVRGLQLFVTPHEPDSPPTAQDDVKSPSVGEIGATPEDGEMSYTAYLESSDLGPMPNEQGPPQIEWASFVATRLPTYPIESVDDPRPWGPEEEDFIDASSKIVSLAWYADSGAVQLILQPRHPSSEEWPPPRGYTRYYLKGRDARRVPRSYIYQNSDQRQDGDIWNGRVYPGDEAMDAVLRFYTGPNVDNDAVQQSFDYGLSMAFIVDAYEQLSQSQVNRLTFDMGQAIRLLQLQQGNLAPDDEVSSLGNPRVVSDHQKRQIPVYPRGTGIRIGLGSTIEIRAEPLNAIESQEKNSSTSTANHAAEFLLYFQAFQILQSHIRSLLYPILSPLITNSNSTFVHQIAWSIWSDLTLSTTLVVGPFKNGLSGMTYLEDEYLNSTHQNLDHILSKNDTLLVDLNHYNPSQNTNTSHLLGMLAVHGLLESLYFETWDRAINATNSTGQLASLARLVTYLQPKDPSIAPPEFFNATSRRNDGLMTPPMNNASSFNLTSSMR